ncbi:hypothetical protein ACQP3D_27195, partial [Escherichia coli]
MWGGKWTFAVRIRDKTGWSVVFLIVWLLQEEALDTAVSGRRGLLGQSVEGQLLKVVGWNEEKVS